MQRTIDFILADHPQRIREVEAYGRPEVREAFDPKDKYFIYRFDEEIKE